MAIRIPRIVRKKESAPCRWLFDKGKIGSTSVVVDYGCGYGEDVKFLKAQGVDTTGYDPYVQGHDIHIDDLKFNTVLCTFVFNTLGTKLAHDALRAALEARFEHCDIYITVRNDLRKEDADKWTYFKEDDIYLTATTRQRFYRGWTFEEAFPGYETIKKCPGFVILHKKRY